MQFGPFALRKPNDSAPTRPEEGRGTSSVHRRFRSYALHDSEREVVTSIVANAMDPDFDSTHASELSFIYHAPGGQSYARCSGASTVILIGGVLGTVTLCGLIAILDDIRVTLHDIRDIANPRIHRDAS